jgi:hypothetical protein
MPIIAMGKRLQSGLFSVFRDSPRSRRSFAGLGCFPAVFRLLAAGPSWVAWPLRLELLLVWCAFVFAPSAAVLLAVRGVAPLRPALLVAAAFPSVTCAPLPPLGPSATVRRARCVGSGALTVGGGPGRAEAMARTISPKSSSDGSQPSACAVSRKRAICSARLTLVRELFATLLSSRGATSAGADA